MPRVSLPPDVPFVTVDRPSKAVQSTLPPALLTAVAETARSGKAVQIDGRRWDAAVINALYRRVMALTREVGYPYQVHGRRESGVMYFWATKKHARKVRARADA